MADHRVHDDDPLDDPLDDALDRALDGGFAAARDPDGAAPCVNVLDRVCARTGSRPSISLRDIDPAGETPMLEPIAPGADRQGDTGKYKVLGVLGQGGVGAVHRGHDTDLGRDVALKFLHEKFTGQAAVLHRFVEEAQIGGQLQHPGIVPVYELGMADGRPFFAMKLVKGKTLAKRLAERPSPAQDRRAFLSIFEDVCQTMAYAHARGVVHRDLKPANVMIGNFGEVQIVDWGMGKVLVSGGVADELHAAQLRSQLSVIETVRSGGQGTRSVMGSVMGTPAYMPPEQARGDVDAMDERSDVFALGAILCEILTGQPPYVGEPDALIGMAAMAALDDAHARLQACGAEQDLLDLTTRCLMPAPAARPRSAEVVAHAIHEHLAAAEQRIHDATVRALALKRTQSLGIALVAVIAVGLAASLWFWHGARAAAAGEKTARGLAEQSAQRSQAAAARERAAKQLAETNLANFNRLSHIVHLEAARAREARLYPAWPARAAAMRAWLERDAKALREALPGLRATLAALEDRALPQTPAERATDRRTHPRAAELATLTGKLLALQRAQAVRSGRTAPAPHALDENGLPNTPRELNALAWPLVDPGRKVFGREAEGLALARRAVSLAPATGDIRAMVVDTLAWALLAVGLDEQALEQGKVALATVSAENRAEFEGYQAQRLAAHAAVVGPRGQAAIEELTRTVDTLRATVAQRHTWNFANAADRFLHDTLEQLVADIVAFDSREVAGVRQRLDWAQRVEELTISRHRGRWEAARLAILAADGITASKLYAAKRFELKPQLGLVPIGMNPQSKLWEFYHLRSAWNPAADADPADIAIPTHDATGKIDANGRGVVFVLVPGGRFFMGAQSGDASGPNFDTAALKNENPVREVELDPYFLSKYEMTLGQWSRLSGRDHQGFHQLGTQYLGNPAPIGEDNPVDQVSWQMCDELLARCGLALPTEAQWEYGCRAGTTTAWYTGREPGSLEGSANVLDRTGQSTDPFWPGGEAWDDRFKYAAPVGTFAPNPFGLYDVHGNVWEWCRDWFAPYTLPPRPRDGLRDPGPSFDVGRRITRGGCFEYPAREARSANRYHYAPTVLFGLLGVRPARELAR